MGKMHAIKLHAYICTHKYSRSVKRTQYSTTKKNNNFDVHNKRRIILVKDLGFPSAISVFSKCFQIKYSRNLFESKYNSSMVTFNSCTDTRQISVAPNSCRYQILLVSFWKMMRFETCGLRFLVRNRAAFCLIRILP